MSRTNEERERRGKRNNGNCYQAQLVPVEAQCRTRQGQRWEGPGILRFLHGENRLEAVGRRQRGGSHSHLLHFTFFDLWKGSQEGLLLIHTVQEWSVPAGKSFPVKQIVLILPEWLKPHLCSLCPRILPDSSAVPKFLQNMMSDLPSPSQGHSNPKEIPQHLKQIIGSLQHAFQFWLWCPHLNNF